MRIRRVLATVLWGIVLLLLLDAGLSKFGVRDGFLFGRALPPFGATVHARQRDWVVRERAALDLPVAERGAVVFDRELGWTHRPGWSSLDGTRHTTSLAARGKREVAPQPEPPTLRVATFGDSFVYGAQVPDDASFQHLMESFDPSLEVLNFGVNAYGTDQALMRFRRLADRIAADVVLMGLMPQNVGRNVNRYRPFFAPRTQAMRAKPRFVLDGSELRLVPLPFTSQTELLGAIEDGSVMTRMAEDEYWAPGGMPDFIWHSSLVRVGAGWAQRRERRASRLMRDASGEPYRITVAILETFHREALAAGAREAAVLLLPAAPDLKGLREGPGRYWSPMLDDLERRGVPTLDLTDALLAAGRTEGLFEDRHYGRAGNTAVALAVIRWIDERLGR